MIQISFSPDFVDQIVAVQSKTLQYYFLHGRLDLRLSHHLSRHLALCLDLRLSNRFDLCLDLRLSLRPSFSYIYFNKKAKKCQRRRLKSEQALDIGISS